VTLHSRFPPQPPGTTRFPQGAGKPWGNPWEKSMGHLWKNTEKSRNPEDLPWIYPLVN